MKKPHTPGTTLPPIVSRDDRLDYYDLLAMVYRVQRVSQTIDSPSAEYAAALESLEVALMGVCRFL